MTLADFARTCVWGCGIATGFRLGCYAGTATGALAGLAGLAAGAAGGAAAGYLLGAGWDIGKALLEEPGMSMKAGAVVGGLAGGAAGALLGSLVSSPVAALGLSVVGGLGGTLWTALAVSGE
ncbi:MAG TPA: hypothetical protein VNO81_07465 [Candidatus Nitrosotenuis sp.]|nr:hypothetical protein [Candidatus Nitrosotenuis sp.]